MINLFDYEETPKNQELYRPLADRMRPLDINEIMGQEQILGPGKPLRLLLESGTNSSIIFFGPPGCGKTTLARLIATHTDAEFIQLSAVTSGVKDLKEAFLRATNLRRAQNQKTILFVDEIHRFNKLQQDALLPQVESGNIIFIGATTENPSFEVISALLSRCQIITLRSLPANALLNIMLRALTTDKKLQREPSVEFDSKILEKIATMADGDARVALNILETSFEVARQKDAIKPTLTLKLIAETFQNKFLKYDKDGEEHYNLISALHKSMRGSDPDASLYWLYRMIESGENPRFIFRRMIRFASEDIGMAEPYALTLAVSASQAFEYVGPPEGNLFLAHLALYLAYAPKSNSIYMAEKSVKNHIKHEQPLPVPNHLRNAPTPFMSELGYGKEYKYPHDYKDSFVKENYFSDSRSTHSFYKPTNNGKEKLAIERFKKLWPERFK